MSENHIPFDFWDDSTLANQGTGKTIEKPLKELPLNFGNVYCLIIKISLIYKTQEWRGGTLPFIPVFQGSLVEPPVRFGLHFSIFCPLMVAFYSVCLFWVTNFFVCFRVWTNFQLIWIFLQVSLWLTQRLLYIFWVWQNLASAEDRIPIIPSVARADTSSANTTGLAVSDLWNS